jgi:UDP-GlcNAc:undecaprenyl-phosphate GlcNAc-1-phosphate transferase
MELIYSFTVALFLTIALIPLLIRVSGKLQLLDTPGEDRKMHDHVVPRSGGLAIVLGVFLPLLFLLPMDNQFWGLTLGAFIIVVFGYLDDRYELSYQWKFLGQIAAVIAVMLGGISFDLLPMFGLEPAPKWIGLPLSFFFLLGAINAVNLSDGLDGLAAGTSLLSLALIAVLSLLSGIESIALVALTVIGGLLGFLRYNTFPARIFMGDTGSQFLGFMLACLAIMVTQSPQSAVSVTLPLLIIGLPILDTISVMVIRIKRKRSPFSPDKNHLHHQLMSLNLRHYEAVAVIYIIQVMLMTSAFIFRFESDVFLLAYYVSFCGIFLGSLYMAKIQKYYFRMDVIVDDEKERRNLLLRRLDWLYENSALVTQVLASLALLVCALLAGRDSVDFAPGALVLSAGLLLLAFLFKNQPAFVARAYCYTASVFCIYLVSTVEIDSDYLMALDGLLIALAVFLIFAIRITRRAEFRLDTQDLLIFLMVIILPQLPFATLDSNSVGQITLRLAVLMYGCEFMIAKTDGKLIILKVSSIVSLLLIGFMG